jgi:hypothetical protein
MIYPVKRRVYYSTISFALGLFSQTSYSSQQLLITETTTLQEDVNCVSHKPWHILKPGKEVQLSEQTPSLSSFENREIYQDGFERQLAKDKMMMANVSEFFGSFSYANKSTTESATWKQMLGAIPEGLAHFGATLVRPFITDAIPGAIDAAKKQGEKISQEGVKAYTLNAAKGGA